jgi:hypothetical protein
MEAGRLLQQLGQERRAGKQVVEVIQDKQQMPPAQEVEKLAP